MAQPTPTPDDLLRHRLGDLMVSTCFMQAEIQQLQAAVADRDAQIADKDRVIDALTKQRSTENADTTAPRD